MTNAPFENKPRYVISKKTSSGEWAWYWNPPTKFRREGCQFRPRPLGQCTETAFKVARSLNSDLDAWRTTRDAVSVTTELNLYWLFTTYRGHRAYRDLKRTSKKEYDRALARVAEQKLKNGCRLGDAPLTSFTPSAVDRIYDKFVEKGLTRQAELAIAVCARAWKIAYRTAPTKVPAVNPFQGVDKVSRQRRETQPATYQELESFCKTAMDLGYIEFAFAARACWDLLMRPEDVFTRLSWSHWRPNDRPNHVYGLSGKNNNDKWIQLDDQDVESGNMDVFYPELEKYAQQLSAQGKKGLLMVLRPKIRGLEQVSETTVWTEYTKELRSKKVRLIRRTASLPSHVTLASFRHGGLTELGDAKLPDTLAQALSRHRQRGTLDNYIHRTSHQQLEATRLRTQHRKVANHES
jgi:hypothetical protein